MTTEAATIGVLLKKAVFKNFPVFTGKDLRWSLFLITWLKRDTHRRFPVNIAKFIRTLIFKNICERLLLSAKLKNKDTRSASLMSPWFLYCYPCTDFIHLSCASNVDFEEVNDGLDSVGIRENAKQINLAKGPIIFSDGLWNLLNFEKITDKKIL